MAQTSLIIETLKKALKSHGKIYADVAKHLGLSEASVKRMFAQQTISLKRLDAICHMMDLEITELVQQASDATALQIEELSDEQEKEIVGDIELLLVTVCVMHHWTLEDILKAYKLSEARCIQLLAKLDRINIIELLPSNRIKVKVSPNFRWREHGHILRFFQKNVEAEFFNSSFALPQEKLIVLNGMLSDESNATFQRKLERLAREFDEMTKEDCPLPIRQRKGYTSVLAIRNWQYSLFTHLRRT